MGVHMSCNLRGMRAANLCLSDGSDDRTLQLTPLAASETEMMIGDFDKANALLELGLQQGLFFSSLPHKLAGLAHHDEGVAREAARACWAVFPYEPRDEVLRRNTMQLLGPGLSASCCDCPVIYCDVLHWSNCVDMIRVAVAR